MVNFVHQPFSVDTTGQRSLFASSNASPNFTANSSETTQRQPRRPPRSIRKVEGSPSPSSVTVALGFSSQFPAMFTTKKSQTMVFAPSWSIVFVHQKVGVFRRFALPHCVHIANAKPRGSGWGSLLSSSPTSCATFCAMRTVEHNQPFHHLEHKNIDGGNSSEEKTRTAGNVQED